MNGRIILNIKAAAKYYPAGANAAAGGSQITLPNGAKLVVGGALDSAGAFHTIEAWQLVTCEDDGTGTGNTAEFCRIFLCSERFTKPAGM